MVLPYTTQRRESFSEILRNPENSQNLSRVVCVVYGSPRKLNTHYPKSTKFARVLVTG